MAAQTAGVVAILLAAGESRRMGQLKALLPWHGFPLLEYQLRSLRDAGVRHTVVVLGHQAEQLKPIVEGQEGASWVLNPHYLEGKTTSIKAGLCALDGLPAPAPEALLILNVDQPRTPETVGYLLQQHWAGNCLVTLPTCGGKGGHPVILSLSLLEELRSIDEETLGIKAVVRRHEKAIHRVEMPTPEVLWDLNTPEQYQKALQS